MACLIAESELNPHSTRDWTTGAVWPDWSYGMAQITVETAAMYGIGDGTPSSASEAKSALFDRATSIDIGAHHMSYSEDVTVNYLGSLSLDPDEAIIQILRVYNGGTYGLTNAYAIKYASNVRRYRDALERAKRLLA